MSRPSVTGPSAVSRRGASRGRRLVLAVLAVVLVTLAVRLLLAWLVGLVLLLAALAVGLWAGAVVYRSLGPADDAPDRLLR